MCFIGAVVIAVILPMKPSYTAVAVNSFISPTPLKEVEIDIHELALNYLVFLRWNKDKNK